ncbi:hypothetical protein QYE76_062097 [Lolium multiflorum]|uniref:Uncharacterized protein n=1 Tax=Lolium multiflorum TaxID=4521 RepID=A0AAD8S513_LOLMU|nr:hypothetical protein QYE76_062097 [Lolium multiflorum]
MASFAMVAVAAVVPAFAGFRLALFVLTPVGLRRALYFPVPLRCHVVADVDSTRTVGPSVSDWTTTVRRRLGPPRRRQVQQRFPRIAAEVPESFEPSRRFWDDEDPDPYVVANKHKMGRTHTPRPGNSSASNVDNGSDSNDDLLVLEPQAIFEELLWEHQGLNEEFSTLKLEHSQCQATLPDAPAEDLAAQIAALKAARDELATQHQRELQAQREETAKLKDQLIQAGSEHARALKEAISAGNAQVEETLKQLVETEGQLRREMEGEQKQLQDEREHLESIQGYLTGLEDMIKDTDAKAFKLFPNSQQCAETVVAKGRVDDVVGADLPWTAKDYLTALLSRISHMRAVDRTLGLLPDAAIAVLKGLWPGEHVPEHIQVIVERLLQETSRCLSEWRHSSARAGADIALLFVCSWYEGLDLDALHSMHDNAPTNKDPAMGAARRARAYEIASYATTSDFIPPPANLKEAFTDDEEEEDEEAGEGDAEAEAEAPKEPAAGAPESAHAAPEVPVEAHVNPPTSLRRFSSALPDPVILSCLT